MNLAGHTALVTGASRGIGAAIATALADAGCRVFGTATTAEGADRVSAALAGSGGGGLVYDAADAGAPAALAERAAAEGWQPDILVNNAAVTRDGLLLRLADDDWQTVIDVDLTSAARLTRAFLRAMIRARWGRVVNLTSVVAQVGNAGQANYAAAKAGLIGFTRALAREVASRGVTVNAVAPGFIDTDMTRTLGEAQRAALLAQIPMARLGTAEEVAALVAFLCSDAAGYITGQTLSVNGGMYMG